MLQGLPMSLVIHLIKLIGQLKFGSGKLLQALVLCVVAKPVSSKLNLGGFGLLQIFPMTLLTHLIKLIGQLKYRSRKMKQVPLLEG
jgi:hypothetical protein